MLYDGVLPLVRVFGEHNGSAGTSKLQPRIFTFSSDPPFLEVVLGVRDDVDPVVVLVEEETEEAVVLENNSVLIDDSVLEGVGVVDEVVVVEVEVDDEVLGEVEDELDSVVVLVKDDEEAVVPVVWSVWLIKVVENSDSVVSEVNWTLPPILI